MCPLKGESSCPEIKSIPLKKKSQLYRSTIFYRRCFRLADFKDTWNILQLGNNILLKVNMISVLIFLLELYRVYMIRVSKVQFTHQSASCSIWKWLKLFSATNDAFSPMFMTWRVPGGASKNGGKEISDADLDRAIRNQFQSTYGKR